ncbi:LysM peptidoglycan-binding domain-containing protein [Paenibacillus sp. GCM10023250]|uniref:LysM peptidoglycan-binding domain-containing protein n=1 Tax=Paenibacillus sp. GCM10023250 TaxID=3252648 RepID=UPI003622BB66
MKIHIVKKGDSLYMIAQKYNVSLEEILKLNPSITNPDEIDVGMKIKVPASTGGDMDIMHQHVVQQGDTLWKLSKAWGVPLGDMIKANPQLKNPNVLLTGEVVNIPKPGMSGAMPETHGGHHHHGHKSGTGHHPLHPSSVMHGVQGLMGKIPTGKIPTGKKPTGQKPITAPVPTPVPMPEPTPAPMPIPTQLPVAEKKYPTYPTYEHNVDLFKQYGIPATEVISLHDLPAAPVHSGYGYSQPTAVSPAMTGGYGMPMAVSPAMTGGYGMPTAVSPAMTGGYAMPTAVSPAMTGGYGMPTAVSPAMTGGYGMPTAVSPASTGGYMPTAVSPASTGGYMPTAVSPASTGGYMPTAVSPASTGGYMPTAVSPASTGGYMPTAVSPAETSPESSLPWGAPSYDWGSPMVSPASTQDYGMNMVSPESMGPMGGYGMSPSMFSPESMGPMGGYGMSPSMVSPESMGPMGSYGFNPSVVSPAGMGPMAGYSSFHPSMVSPAGVAPYSYGYMGGGQVSPVSMGGHKTGSCGCHDKRDEDGIEALDEPFESANAKVSKAPARKPSKKPAVRQRNAVKPKRRDSLPWINR